MQFETFWVSFERNDNPQPQWNYKLLPTLQQQSIILHYLCTSFHLTNIGGYYVHYPDGGWHLNQAAHPRFRPIGGAEMKY